MASKNPLLLLNISTLLYTLKCITGIIVCYYLYKAYPDYPFYWAIVSVAITISADNSNKLAYDRIIANLLGCAVALCLYPIHASTLILFCAGAAITITAGTLLGLTNALRSAMAALIIVIINEEQQKNWVVALERVGCVIVGCVVALLVTLVFNMVSKAYIKRFGHAHINPHNDIS